MSDRHRVDLVRVPQQERLYEREAVLGRDTTSVFPAECRRDCCESQDDKGMLGAGRFVTEAKLEEARQSITREQGQDTSLPMRPLVDILREAKEKKEEAFQAQWRQMKQGKNRPLDEDEMEFLDQIRAQQRAKDRFEREADAAELDAYQLAVRRATEMKESTSSGADAREPSSKKATCTAAESALPKPAKRPCQRSAVIVKRTVLNMSKAQDKCAPAVRQSRVLDSLIGQYDSGNSDSGDD